MISIITSLYKSDKHLKKYTKNIERFSIYLTKLNIEHEFIIIANDPNNIEQSYLEKIKENKNIETKILKCPRETLYATWNRGVKEARYENITFWNVDDKRFYNAIADGLKKILQGNDIVYFPFIYKRYINILDFNILVKVKLISPPQFDKKRFLLEMHIGPFFMTTKNVFGKIGYFNESFKICGDFEWSVRAANADLKFVKSNSIAGIFNNDGTTLSGQKNELHISENKRIIDTI